MVAKTSDIRHRLEQYKLLKASAKPKPSISHLGDVVGYRPLLGVIEEDMQRRKRGRSSFEPSPDPQPPAQPIHDITEEDTELSSDDASRDAEQEQVEDVAAQDANPSQTPDEGKWAMVCRPKVGERVVGGGFLGVFKKKHQG